MLTAVLLWRPGRPGVGPPWPAPQRPVLDHHRARRLPGGTRPGGRAGDGGRRSRATLAVVATDVELEDRAAPAGGGGVVAVVVVHAEQLVEHPAGLLRAALRRRVRLVPLVVHLREDDAVGLAPLV